MFFKDFPVFLYDFNYGDGKSRTSVVKDITRNIRFKREVLDNVSVYDYYDIIDGETPEIISEKFYGTPEYHWVVMMANQKYDYLSDFPMPEHILQAHIAKTYNPPLYSDQWYWHRHNDDGKIYIHLKISYGETQPFQLDYLTAPVTITLTDGSKKLIKVINFPTDYVGLDEASQYFVFEYTAEDEANNGPISEFASSKIQPTEYELFEEDVLTQNEEYGFGTFRCYITTEGRENNPIYYVNADGLIVNPRFADGTPNPGAYPVTGAMVHRQDNDKKRRIRLISPSLLEIILKNYEDLLE